MFPFNTQHNNFASIFIETNEKFVMPRVQNGGEQGGSLWARLRPPQVWMKPLGSNKQTQGTGAIGSASRSGGCRESVLNQGRRCRVQWRCHHAVEVQNEAMRGVRSPQNASHL